MEALEKDADANVRREAVQVLAGMGKEAKGAADALGERPPVFAVRIESEHDIPKLHQTLATALVRVICFSIAAVAKLK